MTSDMVKISEELQILGYDYGAIMAYAQLWQVSFEDAMQKLLDIKMPKWQIDFLYWNLVLFGEL